MDTPGVTLLTVGSILAGYAPTLLTTNVWGALACVVVAIGCFFLRDYVKV